MTQANATIYHIVQTDTLKDAQETGLYSAASLTTEGFIHCCLKDQLSGVVERYYSTATDLEVLKIEPDKLQSELVYENTVGGEELFPHVYGQINMDAVLEVVSLRDVLG